MTNLDAILAHVDQNLDASLEKLFELIRISLSAPRLHPIYDVYSMLVFAALPSDVTDSMVAGRWLMRDRQVTTLEHAKVMQDVMQIARNFQAEMRQIDEQTP